MVLHLSRLQHSPLQYSANLTMRVSASQLFYHTEKRLSPRSLELRFCVVLKSIAHK